MADVHEKVHFIHIVRYAVFKLEKSKLKSMEIINVILGIIIGLSTPMADRP